MNVNSRSRSENGLNKCHGAPVQILKNPGRFVISVRFRFMRCLQGLFAGFAGGTKRASKPHTGSIMAVRVHIEGL